MPRCKLGDRAIITHSEAGNEGKIVRIIADLGCPVEDYSFDGLLYKTRISGTQMWGQVWGFESEGSPIKFGTVGGDYVYLQRAAGHDSRMRPIPDIKIEDLELEGIS